MGKKKGGKKKGKKSKKPKGPVIHVGEGQFTFENGDKYVGGYCAHVSGIVWRQGHGIYTTHDGQVYEGEWKDDKLNEAENLHINFQNQDEYAGRIHKYKFNGCGSYFFKNGARLVSEFRDNKPIGEVIYLDHRDILWSGVTSELEPDMVILWKEHAFSSELDWERGKGLSKMKSLQEAIAASRRRSHAKSLVAENKKEMLEKQIFAKSKRTEDDVEFEHSDWVLEFKKYQEMYFNVMGKIEAQGDTSQLTETEREWLEKFEESKEILERRTYKRLPPVRCDLIDEFYSKNYRNSCPPIRIIYAQTPPLEEEG